MEAVDAINVEWDQLPQRESWLAGGKSEKAQNPDRKSRKVEGQRSIRTAATPAGKQAGSWEYLDHTADVQIHSNGSSLGEAFGAVVVGMYGYMVQLDQIPNDLEIAVEAEGHDMESLLFNFMDECLYIFHTESFVMKEVIVAEINRDTWKVRAVGRGGLFNVAKHTQGTEVKAITYSNMQIAEQDDKVDLYVIVDI